MSELYPPVRALISHVDGSFTIERLAQDVDVYRKAIDCDYIEGLTVPNKPVRVYLDEEGKLRNKDLNYTASIYMDALVPGFTNRDVLVGNVVWVGRPGHGGHEVDLDVNYIQGFAVVALFRVRDDAPFTTISAGNQSWVLDQSDGPITVINKIMNLTDSGVERITVHPGKTEAEVSALP